METLTGQDRTGIPAAQAVFIQEVGCFDRDKNRVRNLSGWEFEANLLWLVLCLVHIDVPIGKTC
jgi:hypothetical protein